MITEGQIMIKKLIFITFLVLFAGNLNAETKTYKMVFVPASEKGDESDYSNLIKIVEDITKFEINTIKVTDYNAAVEAMRAGRAHIAWYGGKTYIKAAEIADAEKNIAVNMKRIKSLARTQDQKLIFNNIQGEIDDVIASTKNIKGTKHGGDSSYTVPGGENYKEGFLVLDEGIPLNKRARFKNPHFSGDIEVENPVVHFRYDTRTLPNGKKAYLISEIQSDTNQKIAAALRKGGLDPLNTKARTNPFQNDKIISFLSKERTRLSRDILDRKVSGKTLEYTANQIKKLDQQLAEVTRRSTVSPGSLGRGTSLTEGNKVDYYPLVDRQQYASAAIKFLTNKAAKEGVDYVSIAPVNLISRNIDTQTYKGMVQAYGYPRGNKTPGSKSLAAYPDAMYAIAKTKTNNEIKKVFLE